MGPRQYRGYKSRGDLGGGKPKTIKVGGSQKRGRGCSRRTSSKREDAGRRVTKEWAGKGGRSKRIKAAQSSERKSSTLESRESKKE